MKRTWRKQKPRIPGFVRSYFCETPLGDKLEADFNFHEKLVRLTVEIREEKNRIYSSTIQDGLVLAEKDMTSGRAYPVFRKIWPFREHFSDLPDPDLVIAIGGCYDIFPLFDPEAYRRISERKFSRYDSVFGFKREGFWERFWRERREAKHERGSLWQRFKRRFWGDLQDIAVGTLACFAIYHFYYDFVFLGLSLATTGMVAGIMDFIVRKRSILMTKVLSFLSLGSYFFYNGYTRF